MLNDSMKKNIYDLNEYTFKSDNVLKNKKKNEFINAKLKRNSIIYSEIVDKFLKELNIDVGYKLYSDLKNNNLNIIYETNDNKSSKRHLVLEKLLESKLNVNNISIYSDNGYLFIDILLSDELKKVETLRQIYSKTFSLYEY